MAKSKKNKKNKSLYKLIKPFVKDKRVLFSILGAAGLGVALTAALRSEKGMEIVGMLGQKARELTQDKRVIKANSPARKHPEA